MYVFPPQFRLLLIALALLFTFTACDSEIVQDEITPEIATEEAMPDLLVEALPPDAAETDPDDDRHARSACFEFVFPVQIILRNGTVITAESVEDLRAAHRRIKEGGARANFVYPFEVVLANDSTVTIENFRMLHRLHHACRDVRDDADFKPCISINYPIEVTVGDSTFTVNSQQELHEAKHLYRRHDLNIVFPIEVTLTETDSVVTVNSKRELARLRGACVDRGHDDDRKPCYSVLFPVTLNINGTEVTVISREDWHRTVRAAGQDAEVEIVFPITVVHRETGEEVSIASLEAWREAREACE